MKSIKVWQLIVQILVALIGAAALVLAAYITMK